MDIIGPGGAYAPNRDVSRTFLPVIKSLATMVDQMLDGGGEELPACFAVAKKYDVNVVDLCDVITALINYVNRLRYSESKLDAWKESGMLQCKPEAQLIVQALVGQSYAAQFGATCHKIPVPGGSQQFADLDAIMNMCEEFQAKIAKL